ncbi:MAG: chordopoxvirus fusion protein [Candidatus Calescibacterium sp.]|nr:chordopoxvirus fusion protein [Candidatus Calescibacterium sp.]MDW8133367.1 chordopoxvirus fusion protein [Candidatus Calescibacterium sp.]
MILSVDLIKALEELEPSYRKIFLKILEKIEQALGENIKREDFIKLTQLVEEIAQAQKSLTERLNIMSIKVEELTEAQRETDKALKELAEAQREMAKALKELFEVQKKLEERQAKVETNLDKLTREHKKTRETLGGLTNSFGYMLENEAYKHLPKLLERDYKIKVIDQLDRNFIELTPNHYKEVNIFGKALANGKEIYIIGECKVQLSKRHIDEFVSKVKRIKKFYPWNIFLVMVTHMSTNPQVFSYAKEKEIAVYKSSAFRD